MYLSDFHVTQFRNLTARTFKMTPHFNILLGNNGSGKTSLLEAIYFLSTGRSFRSRQLAPVIQHNKHCFWINGVINHPENAHTLAIKKAKNTKSAIKLNHEQAANHSQLTRLMPVQLLNPDSFTLLGAGAKQRCRLIDWGAFYEQSAFQHTWQQVKHLIKQRNAALKQRFSPAMLAPWNQALAHKAALLDKGRNHYIQQLQPLLKKLIDPFFRSINIQIEYHRGWPKDQDLADVLTKHHDQDQKKGFTCYGPHRADLIIKADGMDAFETLSRGQQKLLVCCLKLAQGFHFNYTHNNGCLYLIDDLQSELDQNHLNYFLDQLAKLKTQVIITSLTDQALTSNIDPASYNAINIES